MSYTILFAEDTPGDRIPVAASLRKHGHTVHEAVDPEQARECLEEVGNQIDIVILDLIMPENDPFGGESVLKFMRDKNLKIPVILATAWGYNGRAQEARKILPHAVLAVLTKTFTTAKLLESIQAEMKGWPDALKQWEAEEAEEAEEARRAAGEGIRSV